MKVEVRNGNVNKALAIFRKKCNEIMLEIKEREFYDKPSDKRRANLKKARIREKRRQKEGG